MKTSEAAVSFRLAGIMTLSLPKKGSGYLLTITNRLSTRSEG